LKTGNVLVGSNCKSNFVQVRNIKIAKKLVYLSEIKIYLHSPTNLLYPCSSLDCIVNKSYEFESWSLMELVPLGDSNMNGTGMLVGKLELNS